MNEAEQLQKILAARGISMTVRECQDALASNSSLLGAEQGEALQGGIQGRPLEASVAPSEDEYGGGMKFTEQQEVTTPKEPGKMGTWETAMMSVAHTAPSIIQASMYRHPYAPAANIGGRRAMDIPGSETIYGKKGGGFASLLAQLLRRQ